MNQTLANIYRIANLKEFNEDAFKLACKQLYNDGYSHGSKDARDAMKKEIELKLNAKFGETND